ncbi:MAG: pyruvate kinase [Bacilli bacterium]|nr:pyruvate kinase [Bacilli bacterium]
MSKTKIIATIGPSSQDKDILRELIKNGMDVARLNLSHASHDFCTDIINKINELNEELNTSVAIMFDTHGPNVRIGKIDGKANLTKGNKIEIHSDEIVGNDQRFSINYPGLINDVKYGNILKVDDGKIELKVIDKELNYIICEVLNDGVISSNKSLNAPSIKLNIPFLSAKDKEDIIFASKMNVDFLALSFVSASDDILDINDLLIELENDHMGIIAKIENENALDEIDEIIKISDGVMVARGDLGVEVPIERVPGIQKKIINKCHAFGKISIVATEMISSMEKSVRPTRAEVSDIANAVLDGTDAVMLSGETTIGNYPVETLSTMDKIISSAEEDINYLDFLSRAMQSETQDITGFISYSVSECASRLKCKTIVIPTLSGYTARKVSHFRPYCPVLALSPDPQVIKSLSLHFGVSGYVIPELKSFDEIIEKSKILAERKFNLGPGDSIIITGGYPLKKVKHTNFMKIEEL